MELYSPAKINLYFRVLKKRPDGYHEIESLYQAVDLCDILQIKISTSDRDTLICEDPEVPQDESNLIFQAAKLFRKKTATAKYFSFTLTKRIPKRAGLGGGSSNAATTLWGLNQILQTKVDDQTLATLGSEIGSDVAFFLSRGRAKCFGRGEIIKQVDGSEDTVLWIVRPKGEGLSTPLVYKHTQVEKLSKQNDTYYNDLESSAFLLKPELAQIKSRLKNQGFQHVCMTGSGTAFFCIGGQRQPEGDGLEFYSAKFLYRANHSWYKTF